MKPLNSLIFLVSLLATGTLTGTLTGCGGGIERKRWLLDHERALVSA